MDQPTASTSGQPVGPQSLTWWHHGLDSPSGRLAERLVQLYGPDQAQLAERRAALSRALAHFQQSYDSPGPLAIARAPGRLNTLGRHIDHRGGYVNPVSLHFETLLVFFARHDDLVRISDTNPAFGSRQFRIAELLPDRPICDLGAWLSWTQQQADQRASAGTRSDWVHKIAAPAVYLQHIYQPQIRLRGFDGVLYGSVPQAMGLSSSSSLVVAATEALLAVNRLDLPADEYPLRCGEMEWYVGTRGGCGDHAAIKLARPGQIMHMRTEPVLMLRKHLPFPTGYQLLVFDSGIVADKTGRAGQRFNANTATYAIGELYARRWLKHNAGWLYEQLTSARADRPVDRQIFLADLVEYLQDDALYDLLEQIPQSRTRHELRCDWPDQQPLLQQYFATHSQPDSYRLRDVMTYGLSECARSARLAAVLEAGDVVAYGRLMNLSQHGDRVSNIDAETAARKWSLDRSLPLYEHCGDYHCSLEQLDRLVDLALAAGAIGAQVSGAGLGGSVMALVPEAAVHSVIEHINRHYFQPANQPARHFLVRTSPGAGLI